MTLKLPYNYETPSCPSHGTTWLDAPKTVVLPDGLMMIRECRSPIGKTGERCSVTVGMARRDTK